MRRVFYEGRGMSQLGAFAVEPQRCMLVIQMKSPQPLPSKALQGRLIAKPRDNIGRHDELTTGVLALRKMLCTAYGVRVCHRWVVERDEAVTPSSLNFRKWDRNGKAGAEPSRAGLGLVETATRQQTSSSIRILSVMRMQYSIELHGLCKG
jgi:hypothetical protein